jgi:hypothetical protein
MDISIRVIIVLAMAVAVVLWLRQHGGGSARSPETRLRQICHGNEAQAERLVQGELDRSPGISRAQAAARAVERYRRDNR